MQAAGGAIGRNGGQPSGDRRRQGTAPDFSVFYREHWHAAVRLAASLTGSVAAGEDVAQDVFHRMCAAWDQVDEPAAYLRVAVVNRCRSYHRRQRTERLRMPLLLRRDGAAEALEIDDVVRSLPLRQRTVLLLRYWHDLSEAEIARRLGCAPGTVKSLASRARDRVAAAIAS